MDKHKYRLILVILFLFLILSCNDTKTIGINNKFKTEYKIYYGNSEIFYEVYTDSETLVCSFNGTNYLLEKGNDEEIVSTTAPIRIVKQYKFDENGNKSEYIRSY